MLYQTHLGSPDEFNSILGWMTLLRTDTQIWDAKRKTIKNFRACHSFFNTVLDAHILALYGSYYNAPDCETLWSIPALHNWRKPIFQLSPLVHDTTHVRTLRDAAETDRDLLRENTILFLQHGLMYREFSNAIDNGDPGVIEHCLSYFAVWLHSTGKFNYSVESAHLVACLRKIWSPGSEGVLARYMPCEQLREVDWVYGLRYVMRISCSRVERFAPELVDKIPPRGCGDTDIHLSRHSENYPTPMFRYGLRAPFIRSQLMAERPTNNQQTSRHRGISRGSRKRVRSSSGVQKTVCGPLRGRVDEVEHWGTSGKVQDEDD
jgi:hypothetical protein